MFRHTAAEAAIPGVNVCPKAVNAEFVTAIPNEVTTVWQKCELKACISI